MAVDLNTILGTFASLSFKKIDTITYILPLSILVYYAVRWKLNPRKIIYATTRIILILLILTALAKPFLRGATDVTVDATTVDVIADASDSMRIYPHYGTMPERVYVRLKKEFENQSLAENIKLRHFSRGTGSAIGDALHSSVVESNKQNTILVLLTDGRNTFGRDPQAVASLASDTNTTIFSVIAGELSQDASVSEILAARKTPARAPYDIAVLVEKTGDSASEYQLDVSVDGRLIESIRHTQTKKQKIHDFGLTFNQVGQHKIEVTLTPYGSDLVSENNRLTKTVETIDKAKVLLITRETNTPLTQVLELFYNVEETGTLRSRYDEYATVYVNDIEADALDRNFDALRSYALDGGGLVFIGGNNSFEWGGYNNSITETLLPVKSSTEPQKKRKPITVLFLLDISSSTGYGRTADTKLELEKAIAAKIISDLKDEDEVGVIAFNLLAYRVNEITQLATGRDHIIENLLRLKSVGGSHFVQALKTADSMLEGTSNDKYVIIISDGLIPRSSLTLSREYAELLAEKGVKTYTIGVGFDTSEEILSKVAESGNGQYFRPESYERINIEFGQRGDSDGEENRVVVHNEYHYIARNLDLGYVPVENYNLVTEKINSQIILTTEAGDPILTVWRFGLGRVAALSTDDGVVWAKSLYGGKTGKVFTSLTNWIASDLEKTLDVNIETQDIHAGDTQYITIKSSNDPTITVESPDGIQTTITARRRGLEHSQAAFIPKTEGVYFVHASAGGVSDRSSFSVNYPREFKTLGTDLSALKVIAESTGGDVIDESTLSELVNKIREINSKASKKHVFEEKHLHKYLLSLALLLFFLDTALRRVKEIFKLRRK